MRGSVPTFLLSPILPRALHTLSRTAHHTSVTMYNGKRGLSRRSRGGGQSSKRRRGYQGTGLPHTPVEPGYKFFKKSFLQNPWHELETNFDQIVKPVHNQEEIQIELPMDDESSDEEKEKISKGEMNQSRVVNGEGKTVSIQEKQG